MDAVSRDHHNGVRIVHEVPVEEEIHTVLDGKGPASVVSADNFPLVVHLPGGLRGKSLVS